MRKRLRAIIGIGLIAISALTAGCWDYHPMAKRAFVIAIGLDKAAKQPSKLMQETHTDKSKFAVTFQLPNFAGGGGSEGGGGEKHILFTVSANSLFEAFRRLALTSPWEPYFEHLLVIVINEDVLKMDMSLDQILDSFSRQEQMRRNIKVFITPSSAKDLLSTEMPGPSQTAFVLNELFNDTAIGYSPRNIELGNVMTILHEHGDLVLPIVYTENKSFTIGGGVLLSNGRYIDKMSERQVRSLRLIRGTLRETVYEVQCEDGEQNIVFEAGKIKSKLYIVGSTPEDSQIVIDVDIAGAVSENQCRALDPLTKQGFAFIERLVSASIEREVEDLITYMRDHNVDLIGIKKKMKQDNYDLYQKFEAAGRPMDMSLPYRINVKTKVVHVGATRN